MTIDYEANERLLDQILGPVDPAVIAKTMPAADGQPSMWVLCPCCHGRKRLAVIDERDTESPPQKVQCCHCGELGAIPLDMRSTNVNE